MKDSLISRQALCEYALNQKNKSVTPNDIMRFPSASRGEIRMISYIICVVLDLIVGYIIGHEDGIKR